MLQSKIPTEINTCRALPHSGHRWDHWCHTIWSITACPAAELGERLPTHL